MGLISRVYETMEGGTTRNSRINPRPLQYGDLSFIPGEGSLPPLPIGRDEPFRG